VDKSNIPELYAWMKEIGGYFKRFKGGALAPWIHGDPSPPLDLEARATQAFLEVCLHTLLTSPNSHIINRLTDIFQRTKWPANVALQLP